ncbi:MAG TPA: hypothetical protein VGD27_10215 [Longimicrobiales bacterium]
MRRATDREVIGIFCDEGKTGSILKMGGRDGLFKEFVALLKYPEKPAPTKNRYEKPLRKTATKNRYEKPLRKIRYEDPPEALKTGRHHDGRAAWCRRSVAPFRGAVL